MALYENKVVLFISKLILLSSIFRHLSKKAGAEYLIIQSLKSQHSLYYIFYLSWYKKAANSHQVGALYRYFGLSIFYTDLLHYKILNKDVVIKF